MRSRTAEPARGAARALDGVLVLLAAVGLVVVVVRLASALLGLQLVVFATGSMSPAYPQGALAVAQHVPLSAVRVGDVVTVDRAGRLPITHRVIRIAVASGGDRATVRLQGDANRDPDPASYRVTALSRVVAGLPAGLSFLRAATMPAAPMAAFAAAALAVGWALWPRGRGGARRPSTS